MNTLPVAGDGGALLSEQVRSYDSCFGEFLQSAHNGQKHVQAILLREAFQRFNQLGVGIQKGASTSVLDVSCGPGEYSTTWTTQIAQYLPQGMQYFCTDFPGGTCKGTGEKYTTATARKIKGAADEGKLVLSGAPVGTEADLFSGCDVIIPPGAQADVVHWSHSGYHVRDGLGGRKNDPQAVELGLNTAVGKIWVTLGNEGIFFSVHQTRDVSDGLPSEMFPVSHKFLGVLDDVPERIAKHVTELGGHVATVNFVTPLEFPNVSESQWEELKDSAKWNYLGPNQARAVRLLNFITYDFSDSDKSGLEKLEEAGTLGAFVDCYKSLVKRNGGHIKVKCALQMMSKSAQVAQRLDAIAHDLRSALPKYLEEMHVAMATAAGETGLARPGRLKAPSSALLHQSRIKVRRSRA